MRRTMNTQRMVSLSALISLMSWGSTPATATSNGLVYQRIVVTGDPAPGTEPGVVISAFTGPYTHPEPGPRIDSEGHVSFFALLAGPSVTATNGSGIWSQASGALTLSARAGQQAAGAASGVVFRAFTEDFAPSAPAFGGAGTDFAATLSGSAVTGSNSSGVWGRNAGGLQLLARSGSQAPGTAAGVHFADLLYLVNGFEAERALVAANLGGPGVTTDNNEGFWTDRTGPLTLLLREGSQAPDTQPGVVFGAAQFLGSPYPFRLLQVNHQGRIAVQGNLVGPGTDTFSNEAIFAERSGQLRLVMREGDPAPGAGGGATFGGNSVNLQTYSLSFNSLGHVAFDVMLGGSQHGVTTLYSDHRGSLAPVVMPGDPAPGTNLDFGIVASPILSDGGRIAFRAALSDAGQWPPIGIWWDQPGTLSALVVPGQQVPGRPPGVTFLGTHYIHGFNAAGQIAFSGEISDPVSTSATVLVLAGPTGAMRIVAQQGQSFDVAGDGTDMRVVDRITTGGLNENGVLVFRLDFIGGTSGIFTAAASAAPGSSSGLHVDKSGGLLHLTWSGDCGGGTSYAVYRGSLTAGLSSMAPATGFCAVAGMETLVPVGVERGEFFLVVPSSGGFEGSYGVDSLGYPRPAATTACYPQDVIDSCQP
jgi:hypothetical protein